MERPKDLTFRKGDLLAVGIVILLVIGVLTGLTALNGSESGTQAQIYQDGSLLRTVSLREEQTFAVEGRYTNTVTVQNGRIAITSSDCPGGDCVHCGWISRAGNSVVCLPNRVEIRITGTDAVDFAVG